MRALLVVLALAASAAGCGGESGPDSLGDVEKGLGAVKRGELSLRLTGGAGESPSGHDVGFSLQGPFDMTGAAGTLPKARLRFERLGVSEAETTFVSTGDRAWVVAGRRPVELAGSEVESLRLQKGGEGVAGLDVAGWGRGKAKADDGGTVDGVKVVRITSDADAVAALNDVFTLAGQFGSSVKRIEGKAAERLRDAVKSATVVALVGEKDKLARRLTLDVVLAPDAPQSVRDALGDLAAARLHLDLTLANPNQPIPPIAAP